jgi:alpha-tubulin suppressor-like RCC1 family protein
LRHDLSTASTAYRIQQLLAKIVTLLAHGTFQTNDRVSTVVTTSQTTSIRDVPQRATDEDVCIFAAIHTHSFLICAHGTFESG